MSTSNVPVIRADKPELNWQGHPHGSASYNRILIGLAFAGLATFAGLYAPQSVLPLIQRSFDVTAAQSALVISTSTIAVAVALLPWSWVAGRIGRLSAMKIALIASAALGLAIPFAPTFETLLVLRTLLGLALGGLPALALTYLHDEVHHKFSASAAAAYIAGTTVVGALGRLIAGPVAAYLDWRGGLMVVAILCAISAVVFLLVIPQARGFTTDQRTTLGDVARGVRTSLSNRVLIALYVQGALLMGSFVAVYNFFAFRLEAPQFGVPAGLAAFIFGAYFAGTVSSRFAGGMAVRFGQRAVVLSSCAIMVAGLALTLIPNVIVMIGGLVLFTFGFFGAHSTNSIWVGRHAPVARAQAISVYNIAVYTGSGVVGWIAGFIWDGYSWLGVCVLVGSLMAISVAVLLASGKRQPAQN